MAYPSMGFSRYVRRFAGLCGGLLLAACATDSAAPGPDTPDWFGQPAPHPDLLYGYGRGTSLPDARAEALQDLGQQRSVWVRSAVESRTRRGAGEPSERSYRQQIRLHARQRLDHARRDRVAERGARFYVRWRLDLRPAWAVLAENLRAEWAGEPARIRWRGPAGLTGAPLVRRLDRALTGGGDDVREVALSLDRRDGDWIYRADGVQLPLADTLAAVDLSGYARGGLRLRAVSAAGRPLGKRLRAGRTFHLRVTGGSPGDRCTLFDLYPDGRVSVLAGNVAIQGSTWTFPPPEGERALRATTGTENEAALDRYLAVCGPGEQDLTRFRRVAAGRGLVRGEWAYAARALLAWLEERKGHAVAVRRVLTVPG
ncbi:hypothetical protein [Thiohalorhabdus methylotrophus]|uniref:Lipoprotein n=1 Tax=Thiohalorhabdus methylotrophus TaxID=3242694 RepID=A0ABV4TWF0_9GAMM